MNLEVFSFREYHYSCVLISRTVFNDSRVSTAKRNARERRLDVSIHGEASTPLVAITTTAHTPSFTQLESAYVSTREAHGQLPHIFSQILFGANEGAISAASVSLLVLLFLATRRYRLKNGDEGAINA